MGIPGLAILLDAEQAPQLLTRALQVGDALAPGARLAACAQEHLEYDRSLKDLFHAALGETARALGGARAVLAGAQRLEEDARSEDAELRAVLERHLDDHDL